MNKKILIQIERTTAMKLKKKWQHGDDTYDTIINKLLEAKST